MPQPGFRGSFEHRLDDRGRLAVPARYRGRFEQGGTMIPGPDQSLELYPADQFEELIQSRIPAGRHGAARNIRRALYAQAFDVELDRQGRILVPPPLRELRSLGGDTVITGMGDCLEIWSADAWQRQQQDVLESYAELLESDGAVSAEVGDAS